MGKLAKGERFSRGIYILFTRSKEGTEIVILGDLTLLKRAECFHRNGPAAFSLALLLAFFPHTKEVFKGVNQISTVSLSVVFLVVLRLYDYVSTGRLGSAHVWIDLV